MTIISSIRPLTEDIPTGAQNILKAQSYYFTWFIFFDFSPMDTIPTRIANNNGPITPSSVKIAMSIPLPALLFGSP